MDKSNKPTKSFDYMLEFSEIHDLYVDTCIDLIDELGLTSKVILESLQAPSDIDSLRSKVDKVKNVICSLRIIRAKYNELVWVETDILYPLTITFTVVRLLERNGGVTPPYPLDF